MSTSTRCRVTSPATARRCTQAIHHATDHERRGRSGGLLERWPRQASDDDAAAVCTSAELLEHLSDLIDLAKHEGFGRIVGALERAKREICGVTYGNRKRRRARPDQLFGWSRGPRREDQRTRH